MGNWESFFAGTADASEDGHEVGAVDFSPAFLAKYEPERKIGSGAFGEVFLVKERASGKMFCGKRVGSDAVSDEVSFCVASRRLDPVFSVEFHSLTTDLQTGKLSPLSLQS